MKISEILRKGAGIGASLFPQLNAVLTVVNAILPNDKQLPLDSTGADIEAEIYSIPEDQRKAILETEIELEKTSIIEHTKVFQALVDAEKIGSTNRPHVVLVFTYVTAIVSLSIVFICAYAVITKDKEIIESFGMLWPVFFAVLTCLVSIPQRYFGARTKEKLARQNAAIGVLEPEKKGLRNIIKDLL
jgi:hypothetical protein